MSVLIRGMYRSFDGFLGEDETFKDRLQKDWKIVNDLGSTHILLATFLRNILTGVEDIRKNKQYGPMTTIRIVYEHPKGEGKTGIISEKEEWEKGKQQNLDQPTYSPQFLTITRQTFSGHQFSLFFNPDTESSSHPELNTKWNDEYSVKNGGNSMEVKVTAGILQYIEWFGFYEGGDDNPYRIDPIVLHAVLTGELQKPYLSLLTQSKRQIEIRKIQKDIEEVKARTKKEGIQEDEIEWLKSEEKRLLGQLNEAQRQLNNVQ